MDNQLVKIVNQSGLDVAKANFILGQFQDYFAIAAEWEAKAMTIIVTDASQVEMMKLAKEGRKFLAKKRLAIEKARKELKEQALREGKAIDGIANVLKALIVPLEEYLDRQERFVEIKELERLDAERRAAEAKAEEERIAREKAEAEERAKLAAENEKLRNEARQRDAMLELERKEAAEKLAEERRAADKRLAEERQRADNERKRADAERLKAEQSRRVAEAEKEHINDASATCPKCGHSFSIAELLY